MSLLTLATADDIETLLPLVAAFHKHHEITQSQAQRRAALEMLFSGDVQAAAWLIGPPRAPVGYIAVAFGFSIELGGRDAFVDEFYIRPAVRGRGMGTQALQLLLPTLRQMGVRAIHLETRQGAAETLRFYQRNGFEARSRYHLMTRVL